MSELVTPTTNKDRQLLETVLSGKYTPEQLAEAQAKNFVSVQTYNIASSDSLRTINNDDLAAIWTAILEEMVLRYHPDQVVEILSLNAITLQNSFDAINTLRAEAGIEPAKPSEHPAIRFVPAEALFKQSPDLSRFPPPNQPYSNHAEEEDDRPMPGFYL